MRDQIFYIIQAGYTGIRKKTNSFFLPTLANHPNPLYRFLQRNRIQILLFFLFFTWKTVSAFLLYYPILTDEYITIGEGIYLWGEKGWVSSFSTVIANYYGYGYAVLYSLFYRWTSNMYFIYHMALVFNAFFISLVPVIAYKIATKYFYLSNKKSFVIALVAGAFPSNMFLSSMALNETILIFCAWTLAYLVLYFYHNQEMTVKSCFLYFLAGILSLYAYSVHGRGLAFVGAMGVFIVILFFLQKNKWTGLFHSLLFASGVVLVYVIDVRVKAGIVEELFMTKTGDIGNTAEKVLNGQVKTAIDPANFQDMLGALFGQSFYLMCATFGLVVVAIGIFVQIMFTSYKKKLSPRGSALRFMFGFVFVLSAALITISVFFMSGIYVTDALYRYEYYIYGRYNAVFLSFVIFLVLSFFMAGNRLQTAYRRGMFIGLGLFFPVAVFYLYKKLGFNDLKYVSYSMISDVMPFLPYEDRITTLSLVLLGLFSVLYLWFIVRCSRKKRYKPMVVTLFCLFAFSIYTSFFSFLKPASDYREGLVTPMVTLQEALDGTEFSGENRPKVYVLTFTTPRPIVQFAMPDFEVEYLYPEQNGYEVLSRIEKNSIIVSRTNESLEYLFSDVYRLVKDNNDTLIKMWVYGEELTNVLMSKGYGEFNIREKRYFTSFHALTKLGQEQPSYRILLDKGDIQYGPYTTLIPGEYELIVYGENLDSADFSICRMMGDSLYVFPILDFEQTDPQQMVYRFAISTKQDQVEFYTRNNSDKKVAIDMISLTNLSLSRLDPLSRTSAERISNGYTDYSLRRNPNFFKQGNLFLSGNVVKGQTSILLRSGGTVQMNSIPLNPGIYQINVNGLNITQAEIMMEFSPEIISYTPHPNNRGVSFLIRVKEHVRDGSLKILNPSNTQLFFDGFEIFYILDSQTEGMKNVVDWSLVQDPVVVSTVEG